MIKISHLNFSYTSRPFIVDGKIKALDTPHRLIMQKGAAMGIFFMGALVLLEKSQRVDSSLAVSPVKPEEYIVSKALSLAVIGVIVGAILTLSAGIAALLPVVVGVALSFVLFALCGLLAACGTQTLNGYLIAVVPFKIILCVPALFYLFGVLFPASIVFLSSV